MREPFGIGRHERSFRRHVPFGLGRGERSFRRRSRPGGLSPDTIAYGNAAIKTYVRIYSSKSIDAGPLRIWSPVERLDPVAREYPPPTKNATDAACVCIALGAWGGEREGGERERERKKER